MISMVRRLNRGRCRLHWVVVGSGGAGLPQITLPVISDCGLPLGLSVIGGQGQDQRLLSWVKNIWE